jgi:hypothetical protein
VPSKVWIVLIKTDMFPLHVQIFLCWIRTSIIPMLHLCCVYVLDLRFCSFCHLHECVIFLSYRVGYIPKKISSKKSASMTIPNYNMAEAF